MAKTRRGRPQLHSNEQLMTFMAKALKQHGPALTMAQYNQMGFAAKAHVYVSRFQSWPKAKEACNVKTPAAGAAGRGRPKLFSDEQLVDFITKAVAENGHGLTMAQFNRMGFCKAHLLINRFGSWTQAKAKAKVSAPKADPVQKPMAKVIPISKPKTERAPTKRDEARQAQSLKVSRLISGRGAEQAFLDRLYSPQKMNYDEAQAWMKELFRASAA